MAAHPSRFSVCLMTDAGELKILYASDSYDACDAKVDHFSDLYPCCYVDIYKRDVLLGCVLAD
jgi:hypothetical protein